MTDLYPEPPHLSVFVAPGTGERRALLQACDVLVGAGCTFTGDSLIARADRAFRAVSDVERDVLHHNGSPQQVVERDDVLRVAFTHRSMGVVTLGLASTAKVGDPHPLEVAVHAGALSLPVELWSKQDRHAARRVMSWVEKILLALVGPTEARYGAIGIEATFPVGPELAAPSRSLPPPTSWLWSADLSERAGADEERLAQRLREGALQRTTEGVLFRAWRPWLDPHVDEAGLDLVLEFLSRAVMLPDGP